VSQADLEKCQEIIGYRFEDVRLLARALTHASAAASRIESNERLEFLGDAVLGLVVCEQICERRPKLPEGEMTKVKSVVVSRRTCALIADALGLTGLMVIGKGVSSASSLPTSLPAAVLEAIIGAVYLDGGLGPAREFIRRYTEEPIAEALGSRHQKNYKSLLQQHAQRLYNTTPTYQLLDEKGPEHAKCFEVAASFSRRRFPGAWGATKKDAEQKAALAALIELDVLQEEPDLIDEEHPA
jgi:ribonuclease-3